MRSLYKNIVKWAQGGEVEKAEQFFDEAQKAIDTCAKKNIIHKNNASRKKARLAKLITEAKNNPKPKVEKATKKTTKAAAAKKPVEKKAEPKAEEQRAEEAKTTESPETTVDQEPKTEEKKD